MACCLLDVFPVELIHHLLNYFSAHEIFYTFTNISSYIDNVLLIYSNYCVNFKSVTKKEFEFVCQRIIPDQVISLTLSDNELTPGQVQLFLSRFQINNFTRLRSLTLIDVGPDFWEVIVTKLIDLKNLRSFFYDSSNKVDGWISKISYDSVNVLDKHLFNSYGPVLPQLYRLKLSHGDFLTSIQFPYLHHLIIKECKPEIIKHISCAAPQLRSFETEFRHEESNVDLSFPFSQLTRLVLRIGGCTVSMDNMEQLMRKLPNLKYLELQASGFADILDGQRWQMITSSLIIFNFMFTLLLDVDIQDLDSFRSPFWLNEKHWFVSYTSGLLFSVPRFAETETNDEFQLPNLSTLPDITILHNCITKLTLLEPDVNINYRFTQVQTLVTTNSISLSIIEQIVDLNRIQHFVLCSMVEYFGLMFLIKKMPNLNQISIRNNVKCFLEEVSGESFENIRNLEIGNRYSHNDNDDDNYDIKQLCLVFPYIKHLHVSNLCSKEQILDFINQFKQLLIASFHCIPWFVNLGSTITHTVDIQSALNQNRLLHKFDYTYRFDRASVHIWL